MSDSKSTGVKRKKSTDKYVSIIPKGPGGLKPYQIFTKEQFAKYNDSSVASERMKKIGEEWKKLSPEELDSYKERSEESKREAKREWDKQDAAREEARRKYCIQFGIDKASSWEIVDSTNRAIWERKHRPAEPRTSKKSNTAAANTDSEKSDNEDEDAEHDEYVKNKLKNKTRRVATAQAMEKIKEQRAGGRGSDDSDSSSDSDDSGEEGGSKKKAKKASGGISGGLLASAGLLGGGLGGKAGEGGKALRKRSSRLGDVEWTKATWGEERVKAVTKAVDRVYEMALDQDNFDYFGNDMIQCFYDVSTVTGEPIRSKTLKYVEHLANRWKYSVMQDGWKQNKDGNPTPTELMEVVTGMYCMERIGIRHDLKEEVLQFLQSKSAYSAIDYFGWDPIKQALSDKGGVEVISDAHVSKYRLMSTSLIHSFYADRVGLTLGCQYADIFRWLPVLRPYKGPHQLPWQEYIDQCYLVTHIILTTNNWGELSLNPALFPHEYFFLRSHLDIHVQQRDVHLIAEFVESLRCFGCGDDDVLIRKGMRALIALQTESGIWDPSEDDHYRTYHATMCGAQALLAHRFRGFGPGIPSVVPFLLKWNEEDAQKAPEYSQTTKDMSEYLITVASRVKASRDSEYGPLLTASIGGISRPTDMVAHSEERTTTFKNAIRLCAKNLSSLGTVAVAAKPKPAPIRTMDEDDGGIDQSYAALLDSLSQKLQGYLRSINVVGEETTSSLSQDEISELCSDIEQAESVPVTAAILQSSKYKPLTKLIRNSKGKTPGQGGISEVQDRCMALMNAWKDKVIAEGSKVVDSSPRAGDVSPRADNDAMQE